MNDPEKLNPPMIDNRANGYCTKCDCKGFLPSEEDGNRCQKCGHTEPQHQ